MRASILICAAGVIFAGCYVSHPELGGPRPRDAGPDPTDGFRADRAMPRFDGFVPPRDGFFALDADRPRRDSDVPPRDSDVPPRDSDVPPRDSDVPPPVDAGPIDSGPPAPALRMSATTYMEVENAPVFDVPMNHAIEMWVRSRETGDADFCQKGDSGARHFFAGVRGGRIVMGWDVFPMTFYLMGPPLVPDVWTHIAFVADLNGDGTHSTTLYVDGARVSRAARVPGLVRALNDVEFIFGRADYDVDEIRVWRVSRSRAQIRANMGGRISGAIPGMVAYWRLDESGQLALDYTASGNVGILGRLTTRDPADPTWILDGPFL